MNTRPGACQECGGRGMIYVDAGRWYTCPECGGSGRATVEEAEEAEE